MTDYHSSVNLNIRRTQLGGGWVVLDFVGGHWILREGRSRQQMSLYPGMIHDGRKVEFNMHKF